MRSEPCVRRSTHARRLSAPTAERQVLCLCFRAFARLPVAHTRCACDLVCRHACPPLLEARETSVEERLDLALRQTKAGRDGILQVILRPGARV